LIGYLKEGADQQREDDEDREDDQTAFVERADGEGVFVEVIEVVFVGEKFVGVIGGHRYNDYKLLDLDQKILQVIKLVF
jgi:hypothetical protein